MKVIVHFGFPKTGSSTLQYGLFKPLHDSDKLILRTWRQNDSKEHHDRRPSSRLFCRLPILDEYMVFDREKLNILSDESFTAPVKLRVNNYGEDIVDPIEFPKIIKKQITEEYGEDVEIEAFITIRNQAAQIYSQYVEEYNLKKYKNVDLVFDDEGKVNITGFDIYKYDRYITELERVFSPKNVHVAIFEDWKENFNYFCDNLAHVFQLDSEVVKKQLTRNHVNKKPKKPEGYYTKDGDVFIPHFTDEQNSKIRGYFRKDNLKLQERLLNKYDLYSLGYLQDEK